MAKLKFQDFERTISAGKLAQIYLITGAENYLINTALEKIAAVYKAEVGAEVDRYTAREVDAAKVVDSLNTQMMWSGGQLVIIRNADKLTKKKQDIFMGYLAKPSESAILVFVSEKMDGRSKFYKSISKVGTVLDLGVIYENQMPSWIGRECRSKGYTISQEAAHFMTELIGTDLSAMAASVEKIALYIGQKKTIDLKDVETVLSDTSQKSVFDLVNAVGSKDLPRAVNRLSNLLRNNESPVMIISMIARHIRLLIKAKEVLDRGRVLDNEVAKILGVHPFFVKEYITQARNFSKRELATNIKRLWRADVAAKSSRLPRSEILNKLLIEIVKR